MSIQRKRIRVPMLAVALLSAGLGLVALSVLGPFQLFAPSAEAVLTLSVRDVADEKNISTIKSIPPYNAGTDANKFLVIVNDDSSIANSTPGAANDTLEITLSNLTNIHQSDPFTFTVLESSTEGQWRMYVWLLDVWSMSYVYGIGEQAGLGQRIQDNSPDGTSKTTAKVFSATGGDFIRISYKRFVDEATSITVTKDLEVSSTNLCEDEAVSSASSGAVPTAVPTSVPSRATLLTVTDPADPDTRNAAYVKSDDFFLVTVTDSNANASGDRHEESCHIDPRTFTITVGFTLEDRANCELTSKQ